MLLEIVGPRSGKGKGGCFVVMTKACANTPSENMRALGIVCTIHTVPTPRIGRNDLRFPPSFKNDNQFDGACNTIF